MNYCLIFGQQLHTIKPMNMRIIRNVRIPLKTKISQDTYKMYFLQIPMYTHIHTYKHKYVTIPENVFM